MIIDNHVHFGWYSDGYHSPLNVWSNLKNIGIEKFVVTSTSTCAELYTNVRTEIQQFISLAGKKEVAPVLWITPSLLKKKKRLKTVLQQTDWRGVKMHWWAHPEFYFNNRLVNDALAIAKDHGKMLIHTGDSKYCNALIYNEMCKNNPDIKIVLAHSRPVDEAIFVLKNNENAFIDSSFMNFEDIKKVYFNDLGKKILYGSDYPITRIYYNDDFGKDYLRKQIKLIAELDSSILSNSIWF